MRGERLVQPTPDAGRDARPHGCGVDGMRELHLAVRADREQAGLLRRIEVRRGETRLGEHGVRRGGQQRRQPHCLPAPVAEPGERRRDQVVHRRDDRQVVSGAGQRGQAQHRTRHLDREQGVAAGVARQPGDERAAHADAEPLVQDVVQRSDPEGRHGDAFDVGEAERAAGSGAGALVGCAGSGQPVTARRPDRLSRRSAKRSARSLGGSSHGTSSTATSSGPAAAARVEQRPQRGRERALVHLGLARSAPRGAARAWRVGKRVEAVRERAGAGPPPRRAAAPSRTPSGRRRARASLPRCPRRAGRGASRSCRSRPGPRAMTARPCESARQGLLEQRVATDDGVHPSSQAEISSCGSAGSLWASSTASGRRTPHPAIPSTSG